MNALVDPYRGYAHCIPGMDGPRGCSRIKLTNTRKKETANCMNADADPCRGYAHCICPEWTDQGAAVGYNQQTLEWRKLHECPCRSLQRPCALHMP